MSRSLLITGGAGFIGSAFVRFVLRERPSWTVVNLDNLSYAGSPANIAELAGEARHRFVKGDVCDEALVRELVRGCDGVVHLAAESHVDRSIADARPFIHTNAVGTFTLLDAVRRHAPRMRFVYASTDEVYGSLPLEEGAGRFTELSPLLPNSPYAASKAAGDHLCRAYAHTYGLDAIITRCTNNLGPRQHPEKLVPLFTTNLIEGLRLPLYGDGLNVRDWIHVDDHCSALLAIFERGEPGEAYNIGAGCERSNIEVTRELLRILGRGEEMIDQTPDRPGHDRRYAVDASKLRTSLGWRPTLSDWPGMLERTVRWYEKNPAWWRPLKRAAAAPGAVPGEVTP